MNIKMVGWILFGAGAVIFVSDFIGTAFNGGDPSNAPFIGTSGILAGIQSHLPIPLDYSLMAAGAALLLFEKYA
ncbi:MAG: hypothetical protein ACRD4Q_01155 [Candidatus Acidiferrales bacterium]